MGDLDPVGCRELAVYRGFWLAWAVQPMEAAEDQKGPRRSMDNVSLVSLSYELAAHRSIDVIANNIANMSTPGYKRESVKFEEYLQQLRPAQGQKGGQSLSFVKDAGVMHDMSAGRMEPTGSPFDLAIGGDGYFAVQTTAGERYTRNGHFTLNQDGIIVTEQGDQLLGDGGPITITADDGDITFGSDGTVTGRQGQLGKLRLVDFADSRALTKEGSSLYATTQTANPAANVTIAQGMLESSNVQPVVEISRMIEVMRAYEATSTLEKGSSDMKRQAVQKLGSVQ
ncbi:flagellar basal-body rod protein FlgF [Rhizomicrobium electricum]|uniref:Flagellar basal-body rod protein FlgF n=1 Tax=Rhizomicrobium electricum TaxID=480070 RepID=A0ABN1FC65_9PROT|nr:flagellar basal-body rod protein FlgF [Rhizomicrobium electricum]NIJ50776.1 flagellar basal-body rod protein FlgF [Rhizomicrobium electricum]